MAGDARALACNFCPLERYTALLHSVLEISTSPWPERVMCAKVSIGGSAEHVVTQSTCCIQRYLYNSDLSQLAMTSRAAGPSGQIRGPMDSVVYLAFDLQVPNVEEWITGHRNDIVYM